MITNPVFGNTPTPKEIERRLNETDRLGLIVMDDKYLMICKKIFEDSKKIHYSKGVGMACIKLAYSYHTRGDYETAEYYLKLAQQEEYYEESEFFRAKVYNALGDRAADLNLPKEAMRYYRKILSPKMIVDPFVNGLANNGIGNCFTLLELQDSAHLYYKKAYHSFKRKNSSKTNKMQGVVASNLGMYFIRKNQIDSARYYLYTAKRMAKETKHPYGLSIAEGAFGALYLNNGQPDSAIVHLKAALSISLPDKNMYGVRVLYQNLYAAYSLKNDKKRANYYLGLYQSLSDNLGESKNVSIVVKSLIEEHQKILDTKKRQLTWIVLTSIFILFSTVAFFYFKYSKYRSQKLEVRKEKEELLDTVTKINNTYETETLAALITLAKTKDPTFFVKFNEMYPDFKRKMQLKFPDLNFSDLEFCAYLKMNFDTKEIARFANMSVRSVEAKKYRIRRKLDLSGSENINNFVINI